MEKLLKVQVHAVSETAEINAVDARALHLFLDVGKQFTDWIRPKIKDYGFVVNSDFYPSKCVAANGRLMESYALTLGMAKELAMVSHTEKGREARRYFIQCEQRLRASEQRPSVPYQLPDFTNPAIAARAWADEVELKQVALEERDEAIKFRQRIDDKRAASAMGTAAKYSKENVKLRKELQEATDIFAQLNQFVVGRGACLTIS